MTINNYRVCDTVNGCGVAYIADADNCPMCGTSATFSDALTCSPRDYAYDIETYPNAFTIEICHILSGKEWSYELSYRRDDRDELMNFLTSLNRSRARLVGYNNIGFDYPVIHYFMDHYHQGVGYHDLYLKAMAIIQGDAFEHTIWSDQRYIEQLDLYKIHHFDNANRRTSLKVLEFNMCSLNIEDLPFEVGTLLTPDQIDTLRVYNRHDVQETIAFYHHSTDKIAFREELTAKYNKDYMNHNDTKIGKDYFIDTLERVQPGICYENRRPRQTIRHQIALKDVIFDYVKFEHPEFIRVKNWLSQQVITETKGVFTDLHASIDGFDYHFGVGGIHGSVSSQTVRSCEQYAIIDLDVASYYPNLAIANNLYPEHLSAKFCEIYQDVYNQRKSHAKGTAANAMLKLALNGVYGDSNNVYSPFYDPQYTMSITINGQLLLCMLADWLRSIDGLTMVQINTDGLTVKLPRDQIDTLMMLSKSWEELTGLELEDVEYKAMYIRDVNNYIGEYTDGKLKRKGAYEYHNLDWHKNFSMLVVPKAAEAALIHGVDVAEYIRNHEELFDFMIRVKVPRSNKLLFNDNQIQGTSRYYVSTDGGSLVKAAPPTKGFEIGWFKKRNGVTNDEYFKYDPTVWNEAVHTKNQSKYVERRTGIESGRLVTIANDIRDASFDNIDYSYYIERAKKLVNPLRA